MMKRSFALAALSLALSFAATATVSAQVTVYNNQAAFLAAVNPGFYLETFDSLPPLQSIPNPQFFSSGPFAYNGDSPGGLFTAGVGADVWFSNNTASDPIVFTFTSGNITAVGGFFFTSDISGAAQVGDLTVATDQSAPQLITGSTPGSFLGFTSATPFTSLTITSVAVQPIWGTANDFIVGVAATAVPEPTTWALLGLGACSALPAYRRWRKSREATAKAARVFARK